MKKLGIIGGAGPLASSLFYETLVHESYHLGYPPPEIILINYPFTRGLTLQEGEKNESRIHNELAYCLNILKLTDAQRGVVVCNTLHTYIFSIPQDEVLFFSLPQLVLREIGTLRNRRFLLLGTQNTCRSLLYRTSGLTLVLPSEQEQSLVDRVIDHVLEGKILESDSLLVTELMKKFSRKIDGVILGCTDLPVLHHHHPLHSDKPIYDSVKIPAKSILGLL